jgi:hypothetical protein
MAKIAEIGDHTLTTGLGVAIAVFSVLFYF